jgi:hypothetical protein
VTLKNTSTRIASFLLLLVTGTGASNCAGRQPAWTAQFWLGDSERAGLSRCVLWDEKDECEQRDVMPVADPRFDNMIAISREDLQRLQSEVLDQCEKWKP